MGIFLSTRAGSVGACRSLFVSSGALSENGTLFTGEASALHRRPPKNPSSAPLQRQSALEIYRREISGPEIRVLGQEEAAVAARLGRTEPPRSLRPARWHERKAPALPAERANGTPNPLPVSLTACGGDHLLRLG